MKKLGFSSWHLLIALAGFVYCMVEARGEGDLLIFLSAAGDLEHHTDIYSKAYFDGYHYYYCVLFAWLLQPFYELPYYGVKFVWLAVNLFMYCHLFYLMTRLRAVRSLEPGKYRMFLAGVFIFSFRFLHENLHASQITILILWCSIMGLRMVTEQKPVKGALFMASAISIKLLPVVFLPYLICRGYFRAAFFSILFYGAIIILPSFLIGHDYNVMLLNSWWSRINPSSQQHVMDVDERSFHGLSTLLATLLVEKVPDLHALPLRRNIMDVSEQTLFAVLMCVRAFLALLTLYFMRLPLFRPAPGRWSTFTEVSFLLLLIPLIFPHQQHYAFLFAVPAFACCLFYLVAGYRRVSATERFVLSACLCLIYLAANLRTLLGEFNHYYEHFKILTYGALLLIPCLMWVARRAGNLTGSSPA